MSCYLILMILAVIAIVGYLAYRVIQALAEQIGSLGR